MRETTAELHLILVIWPLSMLAVLGILIPSATFLAWKKFSGELPASSSVTIPANQASLACWVPWIGHYSLSITSVNFLFKASQNPDDIGLSKYIYLSNSCTRCSHIKFNHLSGQSDIFKLSFSPRTSPIWDSLPEEIVHATSPTSPSAGVSAWHKSLSA